MPCYFPIQAYVLHERNPKSGKKVLAFKEPVDFSDTILIPCGRCIGCRLERSRQWAMRCMHESRSHKRNCFITCTFRDEDLPKPTDKAIRPFQLFMKRLRKEFGNGIKYFMCYEYGDNTFRPHFHAILFNHDFDDRVFHKMSDSGFSVFISSDLDRIWSYGNCYVGDMSFESAAYVARYVLKKVTGPDASSYYLTGDFDPETGEMYSNTPEFCSMSRRPGIGADFFEKYFDDVYPLDSCEFRGRSMRPPKYYDKLLEAVLPNLFDDIKFRRTTNVNLNPLDNTPERLAVREEVKRASISQLKRR